MKNSTQQSPIDRLAMIATQRTARTDRLHEATCALLSQLENHTEVGTSVCVDGCTLSLRRIKSNVSSWDFWCFSEDVGEYGNVDEVQLERTVNSEGYLHGDFHAALRGPERSHLIAFASRAQQFVEEILKQAVGEVEQLTTAQAQVELAARAVEVQS